MTVFTKPVYIFYIVSANEQVEPPHHLQNALGKTTSDTSTDMHTGLYIGIVWQYDFCFYMFWLNIGGNEYDENYTNLEKP